MAIITPSSLVGAISGNLGGVNFADGKGGPYVRQRRSVHKPQTARQRFIRAQVQWLRHRWNELTPNQRIAWRQASANRPIPNRLGVSSSISGPAFFIQWHMIGRIESPFIFAFFRTNPPGATPPTNMPFASFVVTSGGSKILKTAIPPGNPAYFQVYYGARTFSTAPRRSWFDFRHFLTNPFTAPSGIQTLDVTLFWDATIGDPQQGEQCWISYLIREIDSFWSTRFTTHTFAV